MRKVDDRIERLRRLSIFSTCTKSDLRKIASLSDRMEAREGEVLVKEGGAGAAEMFIIEQGIATVTQKGRDKGTLGPGDVFGEMALLDHEPRSATVTATTPMTLHVVGTREFWTLIEDVPQLGRRILQALARRLREAQRAPVA